MIDKEQRLREWSIDELHVLRSARMHEPVYQNPAELRADVRWLLSDLTMYRKAWNKSRESYFHRVLEEIIDGEMGFQSVEDVRAYALASL